MSAQHKELSQAHTALADHSDGDVDSSAETRQEPKVVSFKSRGVRLAIAGVAVVGAVLGAVLSAFGGGRIRFTSSEVVAGDLATLDEVGDAQAKLGTCVIDADQAAFYLVQAGVFIRFAVDNCKDTSDVDGRTACASSITTVLASVGWVASYTAATLNTCGNEPSVAAACAASMSGLFAELGEFGFIASSIVNACEINETIQAVAPVKPTPSPLVQGLKASNAKDFFKQWSDMMKMMHGKAAAPQDPGAQSLRATLVTQCIVDLNLGLTYLGRLGIQIYYLAQECAASDPVNRKKCSLNIFNAISSVGWAAQFLAQVAVDCPEVANVRAGCAAVVSDFVAVVAALGPLVNGIADDCHVWMSRPASLPPGAGAFE